MSASVGTINNKLNMGLRFPSYSGFGISLNSGVLSIKSDDGNSLSENNPGFLTIPSPSTPGIDLILRVKADQSFNDNASGSSEIVNNLFGLTTGDNWGDNDIPFWIYAVVNDDEESVAFMCGRIPHLKHAPAAADIGMPSSADADNQYSLFSFEDITKSEYESNPCIVVGGFRMRFTQPGGADDWTVQALDSEFDGFGNFHEGTRYAFPAGVMGAASASHLKPNGGTAPEFSSLLSSYWVSREGVLTMYFNDTNDPGQDGNMAVTSFFSTPYNPPSEIGATYVGGGIVETPSGEFQVVYQIGGSGNQIAMRYQTTITAGAFIQNGDFTNGARQIKGAVVYNIARS